MDVANTREGAQVKDETAEKCQKRFQDFLADFKDANGYKYLKYVHDLIQPEKNVLEISFDDVEKFDFALSAIIIQEYYRVYPYLCRALKNYVNDNAETRVEKDYYVGFVDVPTRHKVRELTTAKIGSLLRISGQVVRTHPVHPELVSGTFTCMDCQTVMKEVEQQFKYTQPAVCLNPVCNNRSKFMLELDKSRFVDFQKVRIQETQAELPKGCIPRSVEVILRGEVVENAQAGDRIDFTGTLIVVPDVSVITAPGARAETSSRNQRAEGAGDFQGLQGLKMLGVRDLHYRMAFLACSAKPTAPKFGGGSLRLEDLDMEGLKNQMTPQEFERIFDMSRDKNLYQNMINSLFPTIHGNDEVKRGILLMLFGGVAKKTIEQTTLRGDINLCIVGDPSTAKSQLLKQTADFCPRAIYTSGKASTAAGLTAAVVRDEESSDFVIEAGALMLADTGVCCIDEFDKMDIKDQVAIHEAMEQQTISITKAGVKATLNARTSILAAANPIGGRYNRSVSLRQNIALGAPIISRFDLFFILVDDCDEVTDYAIARKIVDLHMNMDTPIHRMYSVEDMQRYLLFAKQFSPQFKRRSAERLVEHYKHLRQRDCGTGRNSWRITVRQLESMVRLSEAMARISLSDKITGKHVEEAHRLLNKSIIRIEQPDVNLDEDDDEEEEEDVPESTETQVPPPESEPQSHMRLTYEQYKSMSNLMIMHLQREESRSEDCGSGGVRRSELVDWYLNEIQAEIDTEEELIQRKTITDKVLNRLIFHDHVIIPLVAGDLDGDGQKDEDPYLVVHPSYVAEF